MFQYRLGNIRTLRRFTANGIVEEPAPQRIRLLFHHLPKTAGTAFCRYIRSFYPLHRRCKAKTDAHVRRVALRRYDVFNGHYSPQLLWECFGREVLWLTFLREPVRRVVSQYENWNDASRRQWYWRYWLRRDPTAAEALNVAERGTLDEFLASGNLNVKDVIYNYQTRYLSPITGYNELYDPQLLEDSKRNLRESFFFFGISEQLERSVRMFNFQLGLPQDPVSMGRVNPSRHRDKSHVTETALQRIRQCNRMDAELFQFALQEFDRRYRLMETYESTGPV